MNSFSRDTPSLEEDGASRLRALEPASFIVEAPAGAGKTELLTQRYLRLLATVDEPEEIVAITFTIKAATEMRNRILASLESAARGEAPGDAEAAHKRTTFDLASTALEAGARRGWRLAEQPARLRIQTIDALCASLARQMPFLSRFGAQPRIADDPRRHYEEATRRMLALLDGDDAGGDIVAAALARFDNDVGRFSRLLADMLERRDQWLPHALGTQLRAEAEEALAAMIERDLAHAAKFLDASMQGALLPLARFAADHLPEDAPVAALRDCAAPLAGTAEELPQWRALRWLLLTNDGAWRKQLTKNHGFPPKVSDEQKQALLDLIGQLSLRSGAEESLARIAGLPDAQYGDEDWACVENMAALLRLAAAQLWTVFNEAGEADFVEVAQRALLALGGADTPSDLALRLDYRIQHLLVDEFQDTSPTQVRLLQRLTAGWQPGDGRTLFCVGDPMQSIYRFRKADVGLFLRAAETGIGDIPLERLRLCRNNRSSPAVVEWINRSFAQVLPSGDGVAAGAVGYRPFVAALAPLESEGVSVSALVVDGDRSAAKQETDADALEAGRILDIVARERREDPQRRIAVLVRARRHLDALVALIRERQPQLRFQAVEIERLSARQVVQDLLALTRALLHRADRVNWLAILRAPWCGLRLADLHALAGGDHERTIWQLINDEEVFARLSPDGQARLAHARTVLAEAFAHQGRMRLRRWIEGVWLGLGGAACLRDAAEAADIADARAFLDLIDALDGAGRFDLDRLDEEVEALFAAPDAQADGTLQFMTIHKSKGLEFDTVILPGLHRGKRADDHALMLWEEVVLEGEDLRERLVAAPLGGVGAAEGATPYRYLRSLEDERSANEAARVLYVAATRTIRRLHLVGVVRRDADGRPVEPSAGSFLRLLWSSVSGDFVAAAGSAEAASVCIATPSDASFVSRLVRVREPVASPIPAPHPDHQPQAAPGIDAREEVADPLAADIGTLLHACLEQMAGSDLAAWNAARIEAGLPAMRVWLMRRGHAAVRAQAGARRAADALLATLGSSAGRWLLAPHEADGAELALSNVVAGEGNKGTARHVIDRCFIDDGQRWIVDYKTARLDCGESGENDAKVWRRHAEAHRAQLERYAGLFAGEGLPLRLAIYFAMHGRLVELPPGGR